MCRPKLSDPAYERHRFHGSPFIPYLTAWAIDSPSEEYLLNEVPDTAPETTSAADEDHHKSGEQNEEGSGDDRKEPYDQTNPAQNQKG